MISSKTILIRSQVQVLKYFELSSSLIFEIFITEFYILLGSCCPIVDTYSKKRNPKPTAIMTAWRQAGLK